MTNNGPDTATNVQVDDLLPASMTFLSATVPQGTYDNTSGVWTVGTVPVGTPLVLTLTAGVGSPDAQTNVATIGHSDQFDPNGANNSASATVTPQQADLALAKTVSNATPNVGDAITYTITLTSQGPDPATNVQVTDLLPAGLTFVSDTPSMGTYDPTTGLWTVGTVIPGAEQTLQVQAMVVSPNAEFNTATITHSDQFDPDPSNNQAGALVTPQQADLVVGKTVSNPTPNVGDTITFTVTVANDGPDAATGVTLQDILPPQVGFQSATASAGSYDPTTNTWTVGMVPVGVTQTLTITVLVTIPNPQANTASISHSDQFDPDTSNNSDTASIDPQQADLELTKVVSDPTPNVGDLVTFTVTLINNGPSAATGVQVTDLLPAGLMFIAAAPSQGSYDNATGVWIVGTVTATAAPTLQIQADVVSPNAQTNTAMISAADQFDPDPGNNSASATVTPQRADLALAKTVNDPTPNVGDTVTFTVTLTDKGPDAATNVSVSDSLPAGLTLLSATPSQGTYVGGVWTVGTVTPSAAQTLTVSARVDSPDDQTNTATITHSDQFDPDPTNNQASITVMSQQADLALAKTVSDPAPNVGDTITFIVTLSNLGPDDATNVTVEDLLPAGLQFVSATPSQGAYDATTGVWTLGTVSTTPAGTLDIMAKVVSPAAETNTATISHADQFDPDTTNNTASATVTPQQADLAIVKTVSNMTPNVGETVTFTVTLSNLGPNTATNVTVSDPLPADLTLVQATPGQGTYVPGTGVWTVGTVTTTTPLTLVIMATVVSPNAQTNTATITHSDQFDPNPNNNTSNATVTPQKQADLGVVKTVSNATPNVGDTITFTITLSNAGPNTATNVTVGDLLPAGLQFVSATPSEGTYSAATGVWTVGTVPTSPNQTLVVMAKVVSPAVTTNTASITHSDQFDPNPGNNTSSTTQTPQQADLGVLKTVNNSNPNVGDDIVFTIVLTNRGPDTATNVTLLDPLPSGLVFVSSAPQQGAYSSGTGIWTVGTVPNGANLTLTITAQIVSGAPQTNTVSVNHSDQFDPNPGNNQSSVTVGSNVADLILTKVVSNNQVIMGFNTIFTLTVSNLGPSPAVGVVVDDPLPAGLFFIGVQAITQGTYDPSTGVWTLGSLAVGQTASIQLVTQILVTGPIVNTATVSTTTPDSDASNNVSSSSVIGLLPPDLISKRPFLANDPPFTVTGQLYIAHLYRDLLGREADADGLAGWGLFLAQGGTRTQMVTGFENSSEYQGLEVVGLYEEYLHRVPAAPEVAGWVNRMSAGLTFEQVQNQFAGSQEFFQVQGGGTIAGFLNALYADALGRAVDAVGAAGWNQAFANGASPAAVATAVLRSAEADRDAVEAIYAKFLHRTADAPGLAIWTGELEAGAGEGAVLARILASEEYFLRP